MVIALKVILVFWTWKQGSEYEEYIAINDIKIDAYNYILCDIFQLDLTKVNIIESQLYLIRSSGSDIIRFIFFSIRSMIQNFEEKLEKHYSE